MATAETTTWQEDSYMLVARGADDGWPPAIRIGLPLLSVAIFSITVIAVYAKPHRAKTEKETVVPILLQDRTTPGVLHSYGTKDRTLDHKTNATLLPPDDGEGTGLMNLGEDTHGSGILMQSAMAHPMESFQSTPDSYEEKYLETEISDIFGQTHMHPSWESASASIEETCETAPRVWQNMNDPNTLTSTSKPPDGPWFETRRSQDLHDSFPVHSVDYLVNMTVNEARNQKMPSEPHRSTIVEVEHHSPTNQKPIAMVYNDLNYDGV